MDVTAWVEGYRTAWETADTDLVLTLFTEDASYRSNPFEEPHLGHDGIRAYWDGVTSQQRDARVSMGRPFVDGDRVAVEWWTRMVSEGEEVTLPDASCSGSTPTGDATICGNTGTSPRGSASPSRAGGTSRTRGSTRRSR